MKVRFHAAMLVQDDGTEQPVLVEAEVAGWRGPIDFASAVVTSIRPTTPPRDRLESRDAANGAILGAPKEAVLRHFSDPRGGSEFFAQHGGRGHGKLENMLHISHHAAQQGEVVSMPSTDPSTPGVYFVPEHVYLGMLRDQQAMRLAERKCDDLMKYIDDAKGEAQKRGRVQGQPLAEWIASLPLHIEY